MTARLDPEAKRLRNLDAAQLADEAFIAKSRIEAIKLEAVRRNLRVAQGEAGRIALSPPGQQERSDRALLLQALGIGEGEFTARFCHQVKTDWRLTISARKQISGAAA